MASMVGAGYIIYGWLVPSVQLYDFVSIVCLKPFTHAHAHARSSITFACTCVFSLRVVHFTRMSPACDTQHAFNFWLTCTVPTWQQSGASYTCQKVSQVLYINNCLGLPILLSGKNEAVFGWCYFIGHTRSLLYSTTILHNIFSHKILDDTQLKQVHKNIIMKHSRSIKGME